MCNRNKKKEHSHPNRTKTNYTTNTMEIRVFTSISIISDDNVQHQFKIKNKTAMPNNT